MEIMLLFCSVLLWSDMLSMKEGGEVWLDLLLQTSPNNW